MMIKCLDEADIDHDGTLDRDEAKAVCKEDFDLMDKDHDGTLTLEELKACKCKKGPALNFENCNCCCSHYSANAIIPSKR